MKRESNLLSSESLLTDANPSS